MLTAHDRDAAIPVAIRKVLTVKGGMADEVVRRPSRYHDVGSLLCMATSLYTVLISI